MVENGFSLATGQAGDFDVLPARHFGPMPDDVLHGIVCDEKGLTAKYRIGIDDARVISEIARQLSHSGVEQACQGHHPGLKGAPMMQVVAKMPIEIQIVLQEENIIGAVFQTSFQCEIRACRFPFAVTIRITVVNLDKLGRAIPIRSRKVIQGLPSRLNAFHP
jgi:hypothetical protein